MLISEPQLPTPGDMRFFPRDRGKMAIFRGLASKWPFPLCCVGKKSHVARGVENRGSLISVPLALSSC